MKRTPLKRAISPKVKSKRRKRPSTLSMLKKQLWALCREIQIRKYGRTCFTCGRSNLEGGNCQLGHWIPSSVCSTEMRYNLDNLRPQCYHCNINLSGNWIVYENNLKRDRIDTDKLKLQNEQGKGKQYREDWYEKTIELYKRQR